MLQETTNNNNWKKVCWVVVLVLGCLDEKRIVTGFPNISKIPSSRPLLHPTTTLKDGPVSSYRLIVLTRGGANVATTSISSSMITRFSKSNEEEEDDTTDDAATTTSSSSSQPQSQESCSSDDETAPPATEEEEEEEDVVASTFEERTAEAKTASSGSSSYGLTSLLWLSLAFDVMLNKGKRGALFGGPGGYVLENLVPSIHLALGFALASALSYWLSFHQKENHKLPLVLCVFGLLNVGSHTHPTQSFLGQGAAIINIHNALVSINEYWKQRQLSLLLSTQYSNSKLNSSRKWNVLSKGAAFLALFSSLRAVPSVPLEWASLARSTLLAGVGLNYNGIRLSTSHTLYSTMVSLALFGLAIPLWIVRLSSSSSSITLSPSLIATLTYTLLAIASGYDALQSYYRRRHNNNNNKQPQPSQ